LILLDFNRAEEEAKAKREAADVILKDIAMDLRKKLPQESILPSEKLFIPVKGEVHMFIFMIIFFYLL
jgi:hypothetical protein